MHNDTKSEKDLYEKMESIFSRTLREIALYTSNYEQFHGKLPDDIEKDFSYISERTTRYRDKKNLIEILK